VKLPRLGEFAIALALTGVLGWPAVATVREAWIEAGGAESVGDTGGVARPLGLAVETTRLVLVAGAIALPAGLALAVGLFRTDLPGRRSALGLLVFAAFVPLPIHAAAWIGALGNLGRMQVLGSRPLLIGWPGAAFVHAMAALPWVVLFAGVGLRSVEPELEEAALLDLPAWRVVVQVTLRRAVGAIAGAALAVAVLTAGDMTVTDLLQVRTYAEEAYTQFGQGHGPGTAAAVALPPLVLLGITITLGMRALLWADPARFPSASSRPRDWSLGAWRIPSAMLVWASLATLLILPLYGLCWRAGRVGGSAAAGEGPKWSVSGLATTLRAAVSELFGRPDLILPTTLLWSAVGALVATCLAWGLAWEARQSGSWRWVAALSLTLALATPGPVVGMSLVLAYGGIRWIHATPAILVIAYALRTFPYAFLVLWPAVVGLPSAYQEAATLDGLGAWGQFRRVALPICGGGLLTAWGVALVLAMGEVPASNPVELPGTTTAAKLLWHLLHTGTESHLAGIVLILLAPFAAAGGLIALAIGPRFTGSGWRTR